MTGLAFYWRETTTKHRTYGIKFKRQVTQEFLGGEALYGLARRHDIARNLIRVWIARYEARKFNEEAEATDLLQRYQARIAALERLVGRQALEIEYLKGARKNAAPVKNERTCEISAPTACRSPEDVS